MLARAFDRYGTERPMLDLRDLQSLVDENVMAGLIGAATFLNVLAVWYGLLERDRSSDRIRKLAARRLELGRSTSPKRRARNLQPRTLVKKLVEAFKLAQAARGEEIRDRLAAAGYRTTDARNIYLLAKIASPVCGILVMLAGIYLRTFPALSGLTSVLVVTAIAALSFYGPDLYLRNTTTKRRQILQKSLPDGLDLLVVCAEAGLSLDVALRRVSDEVAPSAPELAEEFGLTAVELNFLPDRRQALLNLAKRIDLPSVRAFVTTLIQTEKYGTPLSQSLRVLSAEYREQRMLKAEEKAARLPATLTIPMIVFILPPLFIVLMGSAILQVYDNLIKQ